MNVSRSLLRGIVAAVVVLPLVGCFLSDGRARPRGVVDSGPVGAADARAAVDAGPSTPPVAPPSPANPPMPPPPAPLPPEPPPPMTTMPVPGPFTSCEGYLAAGAHRGDACDPTVFAGCFLETAFPCCQRAITCDDGRVSEAVYCDDSCAQGEHACRYDDRERCERDPACQWYAPPGGPPCVDELPDWAFLPASCTPRPRGDCGEDGDCPGEGEVCGQFGYDPCAGSGCDACGAWEGQCVSPY